MSAAGTPAGRAGRLFSWDRTHDREILAIAIPALGALAADPLLSLADTAIVGRLGADALAALGICTQLFGFLFLTFNFLEYGTTALVARAWGAGAPAPPPGLRTVRSANLPGAGRRSATPASNSAQTQTRRGPGRAAVSSMRSGGSPPRRFRRSGLHVSCGAAAPRSSGAHDEAARVGGQGALVAGVLGLGLGGLALLVAPLLVEVMGAGSSVALLAVEYFRIRCLGAAAFLFLRVGHGVFRGAQDARTPLWLTLGINVVNLVLALTFVYGLDGGVAGAAWATLTAQTFGAVAFAIALRRRGLLARPRLAGLGAFLSVNADLLLRTGALVGAFTFGTALAARLDDGGVAAAAHAIATQVLLLLALLLDSVAIAGQALIGRYRGSEDGTTARLVAARMNTLELFLGCVFGVVFLALAGVLPRIFTSDPAVLAAVAPLLPLVAVLQPVAAILFGLDGILIGAGDSRFLALATVGAGIVCAGVTLLSLAMGGGLSGVWAGIAVLLGVRAGANIWRFRSGRWLA